jgi:hypothetical protein
MTLQERMNAMKETFERTLSAEKRDIRHRATEDLRRSGILDRVIKGGHRFPNSRCQTREEKRSARPTCTAGGRW